MAKKKIKSPAKKSTALAVQQPAALSLNNPKDVMDFGIVLKSFIKQNNLSIKIGKTDYAMVDGWKYAGLNFGLTAIPSKPIAKHKSGEYVTTLYGMREFTKDGRTYKKEVPIFVGFTADKDVIDEMRLRELKAPREFTRPYFAYECDCDIVRISDGTRVSRGTGFCSNLELLKSGFDEYSVISMTETRSIGKGFRNLLGFVMKSAGLESTPAEEMHADMQQEETWTMPNNPIPTVNQFNVIMKAIRDMATVDLIDAYILDKQKHLTFNEDQLKAIEIERKGKQVPVAENLEKNG